MTEITQVPLAEVASFVRGISFKPHDVEPANAVGTVLCMRTKNVQEQLDLSDVWSVSAKHVAREEQFLREGDILISSANSWNLVGKCCSVPALSRRATFGGFTTVLRSSSSRLNVRYLYRWFSSESVQALVRSFGNKTTNISNLSLERCRQMQMPLPDEREQRRIAAILDQAAALAAQRRASLEQLGRLPQAIFLEMFAGSATPNWRFRSVSELVSEPHHIRTGPFGSQLLHSEFVSEGVAVLGIDNAVDNEFKWAERRFITPAKYQKLRRYTVHGGDVLITIMGTCGRCAIVPDDVDLAINTKHLCCITVDRNRCLPEFLRAWFLYHPAARRYLEQTAKGAIMSGLNMGIIKSLPVALPPVDLQRKFTRRVAEVQSLMAQYRTSAVEADALFASLQHRAFSGQL